MTERANPWEDVELPEDIARAEKAEADRQAFLEDRPPDDFIHACILAVLARAETSAAQRISENPINDWTAARQVVEWVRDRMVSDEEVLRYWRSVRLKHLENSGLFRPRVDYGLEDWEIEKGVLELIPGIADSEVRGEVRELRRRREADIDGPHSAAIRITATGTIRLAALCKTFAKCEPRLKSLASAVLKSVKTPTPTVTNKIRAKKTGKVRGDGERAMRAFGLYLESENYAEVGRKLDISRQAATKLVGQARKRLAFMKQPNSATSVRPAQALPTDEHGQVTTIGRRGRKLPE